MSSPQSPFPTLIPAFHFSFRIGPPSLVGGLTRGQPLTVVPIISGRVSSQSSWHTPVAEGGAGGVRVEAEVRAGTGVDYVRNDPDGGRMRLDARVVVQDDDGNMIHIHYTGVVDITPELSAILGGSSESNHTEYGHSFTHVTFETGCEKYKELETGVFVGAGRFVISEGGLNVEYKVSNVVMKPSSQPLDPGGADGR